MSVELTVIVPTHNPDAGHLRRTLDGLRSQSLDASRWETVIVDNASDPGIAPLASGFPARVVVERRLGLTAARRRGLRESAATYCVFVDDDNVLAPDYLAHALRLFQEHPEMGAFGGRICGEFEQPPVAWQQEFLGLLALREGGDAPQLFLGVGPETGALRYPEFAPPGAGMSLRRDAIQTWLSASDADNVSDRRGSELSSGGDNDIVFAVMKAGWEVGYFPELSLTHLIPVQRLQPDYLARLNRGIQQSWMRVLTRHDANPWPQIAPWTVPVRKLKAWFACAAWSGPAARVRWQGACGHFEGRARGREQA